jgi:N-dimethylarginine dimethylaminohydrolase
MCTPHHFDVTFEINPWMSTQRRPDRQASWTEWRELIGTLETAGAKVYQNESVAGCSDMVFPTDVAVVSGGSFMRGRFRHPERRAEAAHGAKWLSDNGFRELSWSGQPGTYLEGGDVVAFGGVLLCGVGFRTSAEAVGSVASAFGTPVVQIGLIDPRFYHLDVTFCPLDDQRAICVPDAWDEAGREVIANLVPQPLYISPEEAAGFAANSVVVGHTVVMSDCPPRIERQLKQWDFDVRISRIDEFLKAGGGIRCMALDLDLLGSS